MKQTDQHNKIRTRGGSAMILVVVVTVLLSVIGIMFLMVSRVGDMMGTAARQEYEMDQAVRTVTNRIERLLMQDLFGRNLNRGIIDDKNIFDLDSSEPYDAPGTADPWLASLEPVWLSDNPDTPTPNDPTDDLYRWPYISNIMPGSSTFGGADWDRVLRNGTGPMTLISDNAWGGIVPDYQNFGEFKKSDGSSSYYYVPADADGDGVADSLWIPAFDTAGGEKIYVAVRIIDNCAMLNLNTAHLTRYIAGGNVRDGKYLSQVDYQAFLRGYDQPTPQGPGPLGAQVVLRQARMANPNVIVTAQTYHDNAIMNIENPDPSVYCLFDISDELEIRNRFLLTSKAQARFERETNLTVSPLQFGCYNTFDFGRGEFSGGGFPELHVKRIPVDDSDGLRIWKLRMNPENFDNSSPWSASPHDYRYYYDRRHVSTFYSFDRNLRSGGDPFLAMLTVAEQEIYKKVFMPGDGHAVSVRADILSNTPEARQNILHLLCAFRAYYLDQGVPPGTAARRAAQIVANMIDYLDDNVLTTQGPLFDPWMDPDTSATVLGQTNNNPTCINRILIKRLILEVSTALNAEDSSVPIMNIDNAAFDQFDFGLASGDVVYGFERQPFISELYVQRDDSNNTVAAALELINPYNTSMILANWRILFHRISGSTSFTIPGGTTIPAGTPSAPGRLTIRSNVSVSVTGTVVTLGGFGMGTLLADANSIDVQRPNPVNPVEFITVDRIQRRQILPMLTDTPADGLPTYHALKRQDSGWKFTNAGAFVHQQAVALPTSPATLGAANGITVTQPGWQMPVADLNPVSVDRKFFTLGDFQKVLFVGNQGGNDPNAVTSAVAAASGEDDIRFDIVNNPELLGYICFLNREKGSLPGRININTAPKHVLAAAIPNNFLMLPEDYADVIIRNRPFDNIGEMVKEDIPEFQEYANTGGLDVIGDLSIKGDFEERDWILSHLSNIFTTRSDVFTAYILVRLGQSGPQRRVMAIFDRSQVWTAEDRPRIIAIRTVPNPR